MESKHETFLEWYIRKNQESKLILTTDSYMLWLESFTKKHPKFTDASWLDSQVEMSEEDYNNVIKLNSLFQALNHYANANYITPNSEPDELGMFYTITFNDVTYKIGAMVGQGTIFYCERLKTCSNAINFDDISQNNPAPNTREIDACFCNIRELILKLNTEFHLSFDTITKKIREIIKENN